MGAFQSAVVSYLLGDFLYSPELQAFWMSFQGAMAVRSGPNKDKTMHWFHAFLLSVVAGYGGACFTPLWMGEPTSMLFNDLNFAACITTFVLVNCLPYDIGYKVGKTLPVVVITTTFAQLFRSLGLVKYTTVCYQAFKDTPTSAYYPTPVFGPIAYGTILGNMSGFFMKGFNGYLTNGMPWPFQNGLFCCTLYHFFVHDTNGPIGTWLRRAVPKWIMMGLDDTTFGVAAVGLFMQVCGLLQMSQLLGPTFSPFSALADLGRQLFQQVPKAEVDKLPEGTPKEAVVTSHENGAVASSGQPTAGQKRRRRRNKKKEL